MSLNNFLFENIGYKNVISDPQHSRANAPPTEFHIEKPSDIFYNSPASSLDAVI